MLEPRKPGKAILSLSPHCFLNVRELEKFTCPAAMKIFSTNSSLSFVSAWISDTLLEVTTLLSAKQPRQFVQVTQAKGLLRVMACYVYKHPRTVTTYLAT